jgi:integrase
MPQYKDVQYTLKMRGDSYQVGFRADDKRFRKQFATEQQAREFVERTVDRLSVGAAAVPPTTRAFATPTLQRVFEMVKDRRWRGTRGCVTSVKNSEDCIKELGGDKAIDSITTDNIDAMISAFKDRELEPGTIRRKLAALSTILKYAVTRGWLTAVPIIDRKSAGKERAADRYFTTRKRRESRLPEVHREERRLRRFLIDTGLRLSEAVELEWKNVYEADASGVWWVRVPDNKADYPRSVPASERVKAILTARKAARPDKEQRVWHDMTVDRAQYEFNLAREAPGHGRTIPSSSSTPAATPSRAGWRWRAARWSRSRNSAGGRACRW